jgi:hypothetical protein
MGLFGREPKEADLVRDLDAAERMTVGTERITEERLAGLISQGEKLCRVAPSWRLEYWVGRGVLLYGAWFVRGLERKEHLLRAVDHLTRAFELSAGCVKDHIPRPRPTAPIPDDRVRVAIFLGHLLVEEAQIRDLARGMEFLEWGYSRTTEYEPLLCSYVKGFYKLGQFQRSIDAARELAVRTHGDVPPGVPKLEAKALRALGNQYRKQGNVTRAREAFEGIARLGLASANDTKILERLRQG